MVFGYLCYTILICAHFTMTVIFPFISFYGTEEASEYPWVDPHKLKASIKNLPENHPHIIHISIAQISKYVQIIHGTWMSLLYFFKSCRIFFTSFCFSGGLMDEIGPATVTLLLISVIFGMVTETAEPRR